MADPSKRPLSPLQTWKNFQALQMALAEISSESRYFEDILSQIAIVFRLRMVRHAIPGHFWSKIRTFLRNQRFKETNSKLYCGCVKTRFK